MYRVLVWHSYLHSLTICWCRAMGWLIVYGHCKVWWINCCFHIGQCCASWWGREGHDVNNSRGSALDSHRENSIKHGGGIYSADSCSRLEQTFPIQLYCLWQIDQEHVCPHKRRWHRALQANPKLPQTQWALSESNQLVPKAFYSKGYTPGTTAHAKVNQVTLASTVT